MIFEENGLYIEILRVYTLQKTFFNFPKHITETNRTMFYDMSTTQRQNPWN